MTAMNKASFAPGEYIRDELEARGWTQEAFAHILGRPLKTVNQIITGVKAITPQTARELAAAFGTTAELWLNLESAYRLAQEKPNSDAVARRAKLYEFAPVKEMILRKWIPDLEDVSALEAAVNDFFSEPFEVAARKSTSYETDTPAQRAWMYQARNMARKIVDVSPYSEPKARKYLDELRALVTSEHEVRHVPKLLGRMGIRLVLIKGLQGAAIDGAVFWLDKKSPVIALSLRYDRIDNFWFTLFHELSHVLHGDASIDVNLVGPNRVATADISEVERRANKEASNYLVPSEKIESFIIRHRPRFSKVKIIQFANLHGIHPGIVVGQLQHRDAINYSHSREMLPPVRSLIAPNALTDGWGHSSPTE